MAILYKQKKQYSRPRKLFDINRIKAEDELVKKYGLKNKREIWKAKAIVDNIREQAKLLITASPKEQSDFIGRLALKGFIKKGSQIDDVLDLKPESILERRLQTIVLKKNLAKTAKGARQLVSHKHILLKGHVVNVPSYNVSIEEEDKIEIRKKQKAAKPEKEANENA